ncbi:TPA: hypothetical protein QDB01_000338 [Burkholderia vietnamiensis]|nr:hypothetical protein [Burkholderia vietnamiensis]
MPRLLNRQPSMAQPKLPAVMVQQLDVLADTFELPLARVLRVILRESLLDPALHALVASEIDRQRWRRIHEGSTMVNVAISPCVVSVFADLMASAQARSSEVARAVFTVACDGRLSRFKKALYAEDALHDDLLERRRAKVLVAAKRVGLQLATVQA